MNEIIILFFIFSTLFILEKKSINLLAYYIGIVIILAIIISNNNMVNTILTNYGLEKINIPQNNIGYISYILILVQISALTILFGFIIMLFPKNNTEVLINKKNLLTKTNKKIIIYNNIKYIKIIIILSILLLGILLYLTKSTLPILNNIYLFIKININNNYCYYNPFEINMENSTAIFINKLSSLLYADFANIIKFMIITIILLFAIIGLFFLLFPTLL